MRHLLKKIKIGTIIICFIFLLVPLLKFNWKENYISKIDNRYLTNNPFGSNYNKQESEEESEEETDINISEALESYMQDRIGFRNEMISFYTLANDKLFNVLGNPLYIYGKDGYVFYNMTSTQTKMGEYQLTFIDMIEKIQNYCKDRNVPFVFVFEPSKSSVLKDKLPAGINYNNEWVSQFFDELDKREINYVNNTTILEEKTAEGEKVFNKKYNVGHWNDLGAFYGVNSILENLRTWYPDLHINSEEEFDRTEKLNTTLLNSDYPIHEYEPIFTPKVEVENITDEYADDLFINEQHQYFQYLINEDQKESGAPKTLVFQGSYMNGMGYKFLENSLGEYIAIHDYENVINFYYYYNLFKPECVIFEVAEYTINWSYFNQDNMAAMKLNPVEETLENMSEVTESTLDADNFYVYNSGNLCEIDVEGLDPDAEYVYLKMGNEIYDFIDIDGEYYKVTIDQKNYDANNVEIIEYKEGIITKYKIK